MVGVLSSGLSKQLKVSPPPFLSSLLTSSPVGTLSGDHSTNVSWLLVLVYWADTDADVDTDTGDATDTDLDTDTGDATDTDVDTDTGDATDTDLDTDTGDATGSWP